MNKEMNKIVTVATVSALVAFSGGLFVGRLRTVNASADTGEIVISEPVKPIALYENVVPEALPVDIVPETQPVAIPIGRCRLTAYCKENYPHCCNDGDSSSTATGTSPTTGRTVAVDPNVIPYGSEVIINGHTYIAEDTGGAIKGNRVDILFDTHSEAMNFGVQYADVAYIPKGGN